MITDAASPVRVRTCIGYFRFCSLCPTLPIRLWPVCWGCSVLIRTGLPDVLLPRNPATRGMEFEGAHVWPGDRLPSRIGLSTASSTPCIPGVVSPPRGCNHEDLFTLFVECGEPASSATPSAPAGKRRGKRGSSSLPAPGKKARGRGESPAPAASTSRSDPVLTALLDIKMSPADMSARVFSLEEATAVDPPIPSTASELLGVASVAFDFALTSVEEE